MTKVNDKLVKDSIKKLNELEEGKWQELVFNLIYLSGTQIVPHLLEAVKKDNYNPDRWNAFGLAFLEHGFAQAAKELFLVLLEKDTEHRGRYLNNLGIVSIRIGDFEEAEDYFNQAYKIGVSKVGKKEAKKLPAWINLQRVRRKRVGPEFQIKEGFGQISKLREVVYTEIIAGGLIAGALFYLLSIFGEYLNDLTNFRFDVFLAIAIIVLGSVFLIIVYGKE